ncbi:hypothetical protein [Streptomyces litchfieldiae]|uniref:Gram-positive cocci surface proteins LPxTG domain-containing protein n=1 Tax=Streptomyces litchfieldiae TaxID=3075543 RepID=A0ABU2MT64_9ACTN|nr:hypothetical protein [Streptomyces sp. DSM 44938]MDT0344827.1 hypothetical protein [Streptomyces sp. DSM 44938]
MKQRRRLVSAATVSAALAPVLVLAAPPAHAEGAPIEPIDVAELPWCDMVTEEPVSVSVEFVDVPASVPATEWGEFTYRVTNTGTEPLSPVYAYAMMWATAEDDPEGPYPFDFEWQVNGEWRDVQFESDYAEGHFGILRELPPGESAEARMRGRSLENRSSSVDLSARVRYDDAAVEGACYATEAADAFVIEATGGGEPGDPTEPTEPAPDETPSATPPPAGPDAEPSTPAPDPGPDLADTGTSTALGVIAGIGAVALVAGVGVTVLVRRRLR